MVNGIIHLMTSIGDCSIVSRHVVRTHAHARAHIECALYILYGIIYHINYNYVHINKYA